MHKERKRDTDYREGETGSLLKNLPAKERERKKRKKKKERERNRILVKNSSAKEYEGDKSGRTKCCFLK